MIVKNALKL